MTQSDRKTLYLVDVSNMFFRAFYAIPRLTNSKGMPTNALYGFVGMTIKLLRENSPDYIAFCLDQPEPSFRDELYSEYKANRQEPPDDLKPQFPYLNRIIEVLGIPILQMKRYEADDVIGTLACEAARAGVDAVIVSGDKDFAQLVNGHVSLYDTMKNVRYDREGVIAKWGIPPEQMIDYLAIVGDTSDNIPGIRGVGPKGAVKLLSEFKTLEEIFSGIDSIKSESLKKKILESREQAELAKKLVTIVTDVPLGVHVEDLKQRELDREAVEKLFTELDFTALTRKIFDAKFEGQPASKGAAVSKAAASTSTESETQSKAKMNLSVTLQERTLSLSELDQVFSSGSSIWVSFRDQGYCVGDSATAYQIDAPLEKVGALLSKKKLSWSGFDIKSAWKFLHVTDGICEWDTMLAAYMVRPKPVEAFSEVYEMLRGQPLPDLLSPQEALAIEMELRKELEKKLKETGAEKVYREMELPIVRILHLMESRGILIDKEELAGQSRELEKDIRRLEQEIHDQAKEKFNIASPKQLGAVLFEKMGLPVIKKTKTGYSTDNDVLLKLSESHSIAKLVIEYRELSKLKSTYVDALPLLVSREDGRIHTTYQQALTATGRLSSINPNLQNIPIRTERGRKIRKAFIARKGNVLLSADYSQIELRVLAEISGDPGLLEAFKKGRDVHAATAAEVFEVPLDKVTSEQRRMAKAVNFGIAYGQGVFGLAEALGIPRDEAKKIIDNYFVKFAKIKEYMQGTIETAKEKFYVETMFGRRRYIDELKASNQAVRKFGERAAINAPMQGTASDLVKLAMIAVQKLIDERGLESRMLLQVHDELVFETPEEAVEKEAEIIRLAMEEVTRLRVPLVVNVAWGPDWESAHS